MLKVLPILLLLITACSSSYKRKVFDEKKKIQIIEINRDQHLFAQDDRVLNYNSLDEKLSKMNSDWQSELSSAKTKDNILATSSILQLATLFGCILGDKNLNDTLTWCGSSLAFGMFNIVYKSESTHQRSRIIKQFNQELKKPESSPQE
ncbi:MAG: hypothetical protein H6625_14235 [Bdellovibrionaceae bacterium]|nr:hypothetical protein [Pseudobdellovibrionaceae bacterium]